MYAQYSCGSGKASIHNVDNCDKGYYVVFVDSDGQCEIDDGSIYQTLEYAVENAAILAEGESRKVFVCWGGDTEKCPENPPTRNIEPVKVDKTPPVLTAADHVVAFKNTKQASRVAYTAAHYNRTAILVRNLEGETHIIKVFETKKAAIEAKSGVVDNHQLSIVTRNDSTYHVSFYNIIGAAYAITGADNDDTLVATDHPSRKHLKGVFGKIYAKIETQELPVVEEKQEVVEIADKPVARLPEVALEPTASPAFNFKFSLAPFPTLIDIENAQKIVRLAKNNPDLPIYAVIGGFDGLGPSDFVLVVSTDKQVFNNFLKQFKKEDYDETYQPACNPDDFELCKLIEIRKDESFVFEELDCEAVTYAATVDAQWIIHPNGKWKIYFHDECPNANDCPQVKFDGWDLNGDEYRIEFGFNGHDERIVFRLYAKDIIWDGKPRDLVCVCRHPDALPEDDMGYKRPPVNPHSVSPIAIPWLATENENEEYKYAY